MHLSIILSTNSEMSEIEVENTSNLLIADIQVLVTCSYSLTSIVLTKKLFYIKISLTLSATLSSDLASITKQLLCIADLLLVLLRKYQLEIESSK